MRRAACLLVLPVAAGLVLGACGESTPSQEDTRDWLEREIGFTPAQAACVVDQVWALDDGEDLREELAEQTPDLDDDEEAQLTQLVQSCTAGS